MVAVVQLVEHQVVILAVAGSSPVSHPTGQGVSSRPDLFFAAVFVAPEDTWVIGVIGNWRGRVAIHSFASLRRTFTCDRLAGKPLRRLGLTRLPLIPNR